MRAAPAATGFTLIEVLVALAVVAISLLAAMRASGQMQDNSARFHDAVLGQQCVENVLVEQRLTRTFPSVGRSRLQCEQASERFAVGVDVQPTPNPAFRRVAVSALAPDGHVVFALSTIVGNF